MNADLSSKQYGNWLTNTNNQQQKKPPTHRGIASWEQPIIFRREEGQVVAGQAIQKGFGPFCGRPKVQESFNGKQTAICDLGFLRFNGQAITGWSKVFCAIDGGIWGEREKVLEGRNQFRNPLMGGDELEDNFVG